MAYYSKGHNIDDDADDFDEYDPTPYGGGYDIQITYGHPLPASDDICHPPSQTYQDEAVEYTSYADVSGYDNDDAINNEYSSYTRYGSARKNEDEEGQQQQQQEEVVDEYDAERTEFEESSYQGGEQESQGYGRSEEEDDYGGRRKYGGNNDGYEEDEKKEDHHRTYYDD